MKIKVIEGLEPWEVMKAVSEGGQVVWLNSVTGEWVPWIGEVTQESVAHAIGVRYEVAIIDDTKPEIDWGAFDWGFFEQYGGLPVINLNSKQTIVRPPIGISSWVPDESPFYYWPGGDRPVPGNVEVEVVFRGGGTDRGGNTAASSRWSRCWENDNSEHDIIAFRITGVVK
jgi:hypothetical protein